MSLISPKVLGSWFALQWMLLAQMHLFQMSLYTMPTESWSSDNTIQLLSLEKVMIPSPLPFAKVATN